MKTSDAIEKIANIFEILKQDNLWDTDFDFLDMGGGEIAVNIQFSKKLEQRNIIIDRKTLIKQIKNELGLELISIDLINPDKDSLQQIEYIENKWLPYPSIELVFNNPDHRREEEEYLSLTEKGQQIERAKEKAEELLQQSHY